MNFKKGCLLSLVLLGFVQGLFMCVVGMLIDTNTLYFEATIVNSDLARKAMLKAAIVHVVVFVGASIIYLVKCGDPQTETRQVEGLGQEYQSVNQEEHA